MFTEIPVSLVLFSLICIDVVERIRHCRLTGQGERNLLLTRYAEHSALDPEPSFSNCCGDVCQALYC